MMFATGLRLVAAPCDQGREQEPAAASAGSRPLLRLPRATTCGAPLPESTAASFPGRPCAPPLAGVPPPGIPPPAKAGWPAGRLSNGGMIDRGGWLGRDSNTRRHSMGQAQSADEWAGHDGQGKPEKGCKKGEEEEGATARGSAN